MTLYATDADDLIHASDAEPGKVYSCLDCLGPVKPRKGKARFAHFYHLKTTPSCRLYSKSEAHLVAQMELQKRFPKEALQLERPFAQIDRIADACWEKEKIVFEIQCSPISEKEVERRISDYHSIGYDVVWLLDDRRYNKRKCRPAEQYLRKTSTYFLSIKRSVVYDQFESFSGWQRVRKSRPLPVDPCRIFVAPEREFSDKLFPEQIIRLKTKRYFYGDRLSRALHFPLAMQRERVLECEVTKQAKKPHIFWLFFQKYIARPYVLWLGKVLRGCYKS